MTLWVARAGKYGEQENFALENNVVVVGWDDVPDLSGFEDQDQLREHLTETYPDKTSRAVGIWTNQLWNFARSFEQGDIVALPLIMQSTIAFGRISGDYRYVDSAPSGGLHQRPVEWINEEFARSKLDSDLRQSFNAARTVFRVTRSDAENKIQSLLGVEAPRPASKEEEDEAETPINIQQQADDQIVDFISRKFRGHDLTRLVEGVLEAQGYTVRTSPPGADGGVDIVAGQGPMGFDNPCLCVQVKSGDGQVDVKVLRELQGVMTNYHAEQGLIVQGLIVSWGGFNRSVYREARQLFFKMRLWDQTDLVKNIQKHYEHLPAQLQAELPMKRIWTLVDEDRELPA